MEKIKCPRCGGVNYADDNFCRYCRMNLKDMTEDEELEEDDEEEEEPRYFEKAIHIHEYACKCMNCGKKFSYNNIDMKRNKRGRWNDLGSSYSVLTGNNLQRAITYNHQRQSYNEDFNKCPYCGSRKIKKRLEDYYVDENGEYIEGYEPDFEDKIKEASGNLFSGIGDLFFGGFSLALLLLAIIPLLIILYILFVIFF